MDFQDDTIIIIRAGEGNQGIAHIKRSLLRNREKKKHGVVRGHVGPRHHSSHGLLSPARDLGLQFAEPEI